MSKESGQKATNKKQKNLYLSDEARRLLAALAAHRGINETSVVEMLLREEARREGVGQSA